MKVEVIYSAAYATCGLLAFTASRVPRTADMAGTAPFWLRLAAVAAVFAVLRYVGAQATMSAAVRDFGHFTRLSDWARPGPYLMLLAAAALGSAVVGLLFFRRRTLHPSVVSAAIATVLLVLLATAHSVSLHMTGVYLQANVGGITVSRLIESTLLLMFAASALWFVTTARSRQASLYEQKYAVQNTMTN